MLYFVRHGKTDYSGRNSGSYPDGEECLWKSAAHIRERVLKVLEKYTHYEKVVVACHGMMIQAVTGGEHPKNGEIVEFKL